MYQHMCPPPSSDHRHSSFDAKSNPLPSVLAYVLIYCNRFNLHLGSGSVLTERTTLDWTNVSEVGSTESCAPVGNRRPLNGDAERRVPVFPNEKTIRSFL